MKKIRVLVADDCDEVRKNFVEMLRKISCIHIVGECNDGSELIGFLNKNRVDVIYMDILVKKVDAFDIMEPIKERFPYIKVFNFSSIEGCELEKTMRKYGSDGFISKYTTDEKVVISKLKSVGFKLD